MTDIQARNPVLGVIRMLALGWTLLSVLMLIVGLVALFYAGAWGCVGNANGWFVCTLATSMLALGGIGSLFMAVVVLFFSHLFYVAGAKVKTVEMRRPSLKTVIGDVIVDILD